MRELGPLITEMLTVIPVPKENEPKRYFIRDTLLRVQRWLPNIPSEALCVGWNALAYEMSHLWNKKEPDAVEQELIRIFKGEVK